MDDDTCTLTARRCHLTRFGGKRCAEEPTIEQAASCITTLDGRSIELNNELREMDSFNARLKAKLAKKKDPKH